MVSSRPVSHCVGGQERCPSQSLSARYCQPRASSDPRASLLWSCPHRNKEPRRLSVPPDSTRAPPITHTGFQGFQPPALARLGKVVPNYLPSGFFPPPVLSSPHPSKDSLSKKQHTPAHLAQRDREAHHGYRATIPTPAAAPGNKLLSLECSELQMCTD